jgi:ATP-dependent RNA helicase DeaD
LPVEAMMSPNPPTESLFDALQIDARLVQSVRALGFETPTPIQAQAIPALLEGRDVIGRARTGSGKTAAFGLPLLERIKDGGTHPRALLLAPTRELALQVTEALRSYARGLPIKVVTIYGGAAYGPQLRALERGANVVVGTPGRVVDLAERKALDLSKVETVVLDEADEMLRMGFIEDIEKLLAATPDECQVALFSATMPPPIRRVANAYLTDPVVVQVEQAELTVDHIEQRWVVAEDRFKLDALVRILAAEPPGTKLVFARTREGAAQVADALASRGFSVDALHGDLNQAARERVLLRLRSGRLDLLVATDVAARGIDIEHVTHVINLDLPPDAESYVHRIGRTGRAGRAGVAISLVLPGEARRLRAFERALRVRIAPMDVPSDAVIARRQRARLEEHVRELAKEEAPHAVAEMVLHLREDAPVEALLAAALHELALRDGVNLERAPNETPPRMGRAPVERPERTHPPREGAHAKKGRPDDAELFLPIGSKKGLRPNDLVGALANECGIPTDAIGRITIHEHVSFVGLPSAILDELVEQHPKLTLRNRPVPLVRARPRDGGPPHEASAKRGPAPETPRKKPVRRPRFDPTKKGGAKPPARRKK